MIHTTNPIIKHKAGLLNLAEELYIPDDSGHRFHVNLDSDSISFWTPIPF